MDLFCFNEGATKITAVEGARGGAGASHSGNAACLERTCGSALTCLPFPPGSPPTATVYRSNWLGAQGHEDRKLAAAGKPRLAT